MGASYHQFCPVAKAMELLDERWTLLVVRELLAGSTHFNDLRRGVPRMSPTLLSKRLQQLVRAGIVERSEVGQEVTYTLSPAGRELRPVVELLGAWGVRWVGEIGEGDLDPKLLLWDLHRHVERSALPAGRTTVGFRFPDVAPKRRDWWLVLTADEVDVCDTDPGFTVDVLVQSTLRRLIDVWRGDLTWTAAIGGGSVTLEGPEHLRRRLPDWFEPSTFAAVPRVVRAG